MAWIERCFFVFLGILMTFGVLFVKNTYESLDCSDTSHHTAYYVVKDGIPYCFVKQNRYPYRVYGGILVTKD